MTDGEIKGAIRELFPQLNGNAVNRLAHQMRTDLVFNGTSMPNSKDEVEARVWERIRTIRKRNKEFHHDKFSNKDAMDSINIWADHKKTRRE